MVQNLSKTRMDNFLVSKQACPEKSTDGSANKLLGIITQKRVRWDAFKILSKSPINKHQSNFEVQMLARVILILKGNYTIPFSR